MSTSEPTLYSILGVAPDADAAALRAAFLSCARSTHPDRAACAAATDTAAAAAELSSPALGVAAPDAAAAFARVQGAWEVLGDAARRREYDASLAAAARGSRPRPRPLVDAVPRGEWTRSPSGASLRLACRCGGEYALRADADAGSEAPCDACSLFVALGGAQ